uniref:Uncharacterized protein n=1 Tax=Cacopsylla melanoneura TaxID=428564 RepID=A0A8D8VN25_9HEMI
MLWLVLGVYEFEKFGGRGAQIGGLKFGFSKIKHYLYLLLIFFHIIRSRLITVPGTANEEIQSCSFRRWKYYQEKFSHTFEFNFFEEVQSVEELIPFEETLMKSTMGKVRAFLFLQNHNNMIVKRDFFSHQHFKLLSRKGSV